MSLSAIGRYGTGYDNIASGKKILTGADNAAGLAILQKLVSQTNGYDVGADNALTGQDLLKTADGALGNIGDSLQRIRELSVQASNGIYTADDLSFIQDEIDQLKGSIQGVARGTEFNTMKLLDGSMADMDLATNPSGGGMSIQMANATLEELGIADYDVTKKFDISAIDSAMKAVTKARGSLGGRSNALDSVVNYNQYASYNLTAAQSRIADEDMGKAISAQKKDQVLQQYRIFAQRAQIDRNSNATLMAKMFG